MLASSDTGSTFVCRALSGLYQSAPRSPGFWLGVANGKHQQKSDGRRGVRALILLPCQSHRFLCLKPQLLLRALSYSYNLLSSPGFRICSFPWERGRGRKRKMGRQGEENERSLSEQFRTLVHLTSPGALPFLRLRHEHLSRVISCLAYVLSQPLYSPQNWSSERWNDLSKFTRWRIKALIQPSNSDSKFNLVSSPRLPFLSIQCLLPNNDQTFRKMKPSWKKVSLEFDFISLASTTEFCPLMLAPCSLVPWMPVLAWSLEGSWTHLKCWKIYSFYVVPNLPRLAQESFL